MAQVIQSQIVPADTGIVQTAMNNRQSMINNLIGLAPNLINTFMEIDQRTREVNAANDARTAQNLLNRRNELLAMPELWDESPDGVDNPLFAEFADVTKQLNYFDQYGKFGNKLGVFGALERWGNDIRQGVENPDPNHYVNLITGADGEKPETNKHIPTEAALAQLSFSDEELDALQSQTGYKDAVSKYSELNRAYQNHPFRGKNKVEAEKKKIQLTEELNAARAAYRNILDGSTPEQRQAAMERLQQVQMAYNNIDKQLKDYENLQADLGKAYETFKTTERSYYESSLQAQNMKADELRQAAKENVYGFFSPDFIKRNFGNTIDEVEARTIRQLYQEMNKPENVLNMIVRRGAAGMTDTSKQVIESVREQLTQQLEGYQGTPLYDQVKAIIELQDPYEMAVAIDKFNQQQQAAASTDSTLAAEGSTPSVQGQQQVSSSIASIAGSNIQQPAFNPNAVEQSLTVKQGVAKPIIDKFGANTNLIIGRSGNTPDPTWDEIKKQQFAQWVAARDGALAAAPKLFIEQFIPGAKGTANEANLINAFNRAVAARGNPKVAAQILREELKFELANKNASDEELVKAFTDRREVIAHNAAAKKLENPLYTFESLNTGTTVVAGKPVSEATLYAPNIISGELAVNKPVPKEEVVEPKPVKQLSVVFKNPGYDTVLGTSLDDLVKANEVFTRAGAGESIDPAELRRAEFTLKGVTPITKQLFQVNENMMVNIPGVGTVKAGDYLRKVSQSPESLERIYNRLNGRNVTFEQLLLDPTVQSDKDLYDRLSEASKRFMDASAEARAVVNSSITLRNNLLDNEIDVADLIEKQRWNNIQADNMDLDNRVKLAELALKQASSGPDASKAMQEFMDTIKTSSTILNTLQDTQQVALRNYNNTFQAWLASRPLLGGSIEEKEKLFAKETPGAQEIYNLKQSLSLSIVGLSNSVNSMLASQGMAQTPNQATSATAGNNRQNGNTGRTANVTNYLSTLKQ